MHLREVLNLVDITNLANFIIIKFYYIKHIDGLHHSFIIFLAQHCNKLTLKKMEPWIFLQVIVELLWAEVLVGWKLLKPLSVGIRCLVLKRLLLWHGTWKTQRSKAYRRDEPISMGLKAWQGPTDSVVELDGRTCSWDHLYWGTTWLERPLFQGPLNICILPTCSTVHSCVSI